MLSVRLPKELEDRLTALAETTKRSKTFYIREAIENYLENMEDMYIALYRLENPGERISNKEVGERLGLK
ncbi:MAG TPA: ribbon-helix-helix domain-containing protein [Deltaproteobacteria bacterium]|jgi:RHH-type rel operon transcriptional repressor/antitoxin RelB|nr:ribbon-helix-helix domain-containing protein [Deltaproteobacteria bacterium]